MKEIFSKKQVMDLIALAWDLNVDLKVVVSTALDIYQDERYSGTWINLLENTYGRITEGEINYPTE